jgi:serine phosphatase RsbU (regulator of sigma subunit)
MMMIQAIVVSLVRTNPALPPSRHLVALNSVLHDNLRNRLELNDYATFTLIRYDHDGTLTFAGAHEELIVYRARSRRCECIEVPGAWIGAIADLAAVTTDFTTRLEPDDLLVLHTDGVTEAMNAHGELFGLARLCATIESLASCEVSAIVKGISEAVGHWHVTQQDDVTVVVARYIGFEERP